MGIEVLDFAEPFFTVLYLKEQAIFKVGMPSILLNLSVDPIIINNTELGFYESTIVTNVEITNIKKALLVDDYDRNSTADQEDFFKSIMNVWTIAREYTGNPNHENVQMWFSPKVQIDDDLFVNMSFGNKVPVEIGMHRTHSAILKEMHTQIVGYGKVQMFRYNDLSSIFREELMAPGCSHHTMFNASGNYPWHQYETVTRGIKMVTELR